MRVLQNYVGGQWIDSTSRNLRQSFNPANHEELLCETQDSNPADAAAAIQAAEKAFATWARTPMPKRAALLQDFLSHFKSREEEFVRAITRENGKTLRESRAEFLDRASSFGRFRLQRPDAGGPPNASHPGRVVGTGVGADRSNHVSFRGWGSPCMLARETHFLMLMLASEGIRGGRVGAGYRIKNMAKKWPSKFFQQKSQRV